jgi:uncharacterized membrane protein YsdA (DUF1294 family)
MGVSMEQVIFIYITVMSILAFAMMGIDKRKAHRHKWRISESNLFIVGLLGGGVGVLLGMNFFHHKTKHLKFTLGIPLVVLMNIVLLVYLLQKLK